MHQLKTRKKDARAWLAHPNRAIGVNRCTPSYLLSKKRGFPEIRSMSSYCKYLIGASIFPFDYWLVFECVTQGIKFFLFFLGLDRSQFYFRFP